MSFRLWTIFYVFALLAAAMATFGPWGIMLIVPILALWAYYWKHGYTRTIWLWFALSAALFGFWALLDPAVRAAHDAAERGTCIWRIHELGFGVLKYADTVKTLPPAYTVDAAGKPMHSWRLLIDPYLDSGPLTPGYRLSESWDGPNNRKLAAPRPEYYCCPNHAHLNPTETTYFAVVGPEAAFTPGVGRNPAAITDGAANTIMLVEASDRHVNWMKPRDLTIDEAVELLTTKPRSGHTQVVEGLLTTNYYETSMRYVMFCDGHFDWLAPLKDPAVAPALLTIAGGEAIPNDLNKFDSPQYVEPVVTTTIKWGRVWGFGVFAILAVLPVFWVPWRKVADAGSPPLVDESKIHLR